MATRTKSASVKPPSKSETISYIAEKTGYTKAQVNVVLDALIDVTADSLKNYKQFTIPGLVKITVVHKEAKHARPGRNPFTGEAITVKAKPAHDAVRVRALKRLKIMV
jgi:nucleoid DNA-binding protein